VSSFRPQNHHHRLAGIELIELEVPAQQLDKNTTAQLSKSAMNQLTQAQTLLKN
tara:strand:+ start:1031 stop:1192 length:162 start_codon:yes stop_codon:yes gene_type:complete